MKILFVVNPKSGKGSNEDIEGKISNFASKEGIDYEIYKTEGKGDKANIESYIKRFRPKTLVTAGGDGTINLVVPLILKHKIELGIIPAGSANGLAYNLNIPVDIEKSLEKLTQKQPTPIDVITLNETFYCLHLSDTGINARVVKRFEKEGSKGLVGYGKQLIKELFSGDSAFRVKINTGEIRKSTKAEMVVIANATSYGTGAQINPQGEINDGKFEIVVIKPYPWWILIKMAVSFFTGGLTRLENVRVYSTSSATITFKEPRDLQIDGETKEGIKYLQAKIIPAAIKVYY